MRIPRVGKRTGRLVAFMMAMFGVTISYGVLGACLINFDKIKMVLMMGCATNPDFDIFIPMFNWTLDVALAHNLTLLTAVVAALTGAMSCITMGYLFGRLVSKSA